MYNYGVKLLFDGIAGMNERFGDKHGISKENFSCGRQ